MNAPRIKTIDPKVLAEWLRAGVLEGKAGINKSTQGVPQGGIISPIIANMTLDGLRKTAKESVKHLSPLLWRGEFPPPKGGG